MLNYLWPPRQQKVGSARINTAFQYKIIFAYLKILLRNFVLQFKFYWANFAYLFFSKQKINFNEIAFIDLDKFAKFDNRTNN